MSERYEPEVLDEQDYDEFDDYGDEPGCMTCGGDGIEECEDVDSSEGCWVADCNGYHHTCTNCRGSGKAKDQVYW